MSVKGDPAQPQSPPLPKPKPRSSKEKGPPRQTSFLQESLSLARHLDVDYVLFICDSLLPPEVFKQRHLRKKILVATSSEKIAAQYHEDGLRCETIPAYAFDRFEKIKVALAAFVSSGVLTDGLNVLSVMGSPDTLSMDTCLLTQIGAPSQERSALGVLQASENFSPPVLEAVFNIALSVGYEGFEGAPVGTIFVVGDSTAVMEKSKQLTLNPFQGYSENEKNILDPKIRDAIKNFCLLDGAFIIREDGVVLAAGRYLRSSEDQELDLPLGLGTRNAAAMAITKSSNSIAFVISKTTGAVRIYKGGDLAVEVKQPRRRT